MAKIRKMIRMTSEISTASMSDIAFLLIVFFMVASVFSIKDGLHLVLPDKNKKPIIKSSSDIITVVIPDSNHIIVDNKNTMRHDLEATLSALKTRKGGFVLLKINSRVPYHRAVEIIDAIKYSGFSKLSIKMI